jgi:PAS domain S-box-containing protein
MTCQPNIEADTASTAFAAPQSGTDAGLKERIYAARVRLLYSGTSLAVAMNSIIAGILAVVQRNVVESGVVLGWLVFMAASMLWRVWLAKRFKAAAPEDGGTLVWARLYMFATAWTGIAWGIAGIFMLPETSPPHQIVTAFVLGGIAAGAMVMLTRIYLVYLVFVIPTLTPVALHFMWLGGETGYGMAITYVLFLGFLLNAGRRQSDVLGQSLRLAMDNEDLVDHLTEEKTRVEQLNSELRHEMAEREKVAGDLREREASLANAQRIAGLGSWEWDAQTNEVKYSDEGYRIFGLDKNTPSSYQEAKDRIPEEDWERIEAKIQHAFETGAPYSVEHRLLHPELGERFILERAQVVRDSRGEIAGLVGTAHDITEQNLMLRELEDARQLAEDGSRAKSRFLANMSHEFRTPLNAIIGYSEILKEDAVEAGQTNSAADLDRINVAGQHLLALVNEVLDLSKIEAGRMELFVESFGVSDLVGELVSTVRPLAAAQGNELIVDCDSNLREMTADVTKVRQILYNLLSNAAKFTEGGRITVKARRLEEPGTEDHDGWIVFTVTDSGIGMARDRIEAAFRAFDQLDPSTTRKYGGTGLGLAISRHYSEMMGGAISADSEFGGGSVFTVRLPASVKASRAQVTAGATD